MNTAKKDAIAMLTDDHREVEELFQQYEKLGEDANDRKKQIADRICTALTLHATIEEEIFYPAVRERAATTRNWSTRPSSSTPAPRT